MEGVATELLYQATLSSLFVITHNILCQQITDSNKNGFECNIQCQKEIIMGSYKHLSTSYQLFIITEVKL